MKGYVVKGIYVGNVGLETSDILDDIVYLSMDKALLGQENYKLRHPNDYNNFVVKEVKIIS